MLAIETSMQDTRQQQQRLDAELKMMAQLADLSEEIGADDWTIARDEITRRKLIKQTPRYKVYKADWFGDVIVYEPVRKQAPAARRRRCQRESWTKSISLKKSCNASSNSSTCSDRAVDCDDFRTRLNELCLSLDRDCTTTSSSGNKIDSEQGVDSAYSSISSTPQYYTKHNLKHEFEFPSQTTSTIEAHVCDQLSSQCNNQQEQHKQQQEMKHHSEMSVSSGYFSNGSSVSRKSSPTSPPVVLNKDSFPHGLESDQDDDDDEWLVEEAHHTIETDESNYKCSDGNCCSSSMSTGTEATFATAATITSGHWSELNELRLIAHENFMLFMGASIENSALDMSDQLEQTTSLVMQMSHPKSVSLHDLLHADKTSASHSSGAGSPVFSPTSNRFFSSYQCKRELARRQLTIEAKLNICQQVTDAMTYLHEKNIVHGRLTSVNVYIEPNQRVKISLIDTDERQIVAATVCTSEADNVASKSCGNSTDDCYERRPVAAFNLPTLTYLSPELIRTIRVAPATEYTSNMETSQQASEIRMDTSLLTKEADVFSFGTLLFELFEERFPFSDRTKPTESRIRSPPARLGGTTTKLVSSLCLDSPTTPRSNYYFEQRECLTPPHTKQQQKSMIIETKHCDKTENWNGNIRTSASELIYQIGSGQIAQRNSLTEIGQMYPALVEHIISACWSLEPAKRPSFKQLRFE